MESQIIEVFSMIGSIKYSLGWSIIYKLKDGTIKVGPDLYRLESHAEEDGKYMAEKYPEDNFYSMYGTPKELPRYF